MSLNAVFVVQHSYELDGCDETKFIGVYRTRVAAEAAVERLQSRPGFQAHRDDFHIDHYELDRDHWTAGFVTKHR